MNPAAENAIVEKLARIVFAGMDPSWAQTALEIAFAARASEVNTWWRPSRGAPWQPTDAYLAESMDLAELFVDLRTLMYREGAGTWLSARLEVTAQGDYHADYDFDTRPEFERPIDPARFLEDFERYPRAPERVPDWLDDEVA